MKISSLMGKVRGGKWVTLATPEVPFVDQKKMLKKIRIEGGAAVIDKKKIELEEAVLFVSGSGKWVGFKKPVVIKEEKKGE